MERYRKLQTRQEVINLVKNLPNKSPLGQIWQTDKFDKRILLNIQEIEIQPDGIMFNLDGDIKFDKELPVYFKVSPQNFIFKLESINFTTAENLLYCIFPNEGLAKELRNNDRVHFSSKSNIVITFTGEHGVHSSILKNISKNGLGISISPHLSILYSVGSKFNITHVDKVILMERMQAEIRFLKDLDDKNVEAGLLLENEMSEEFFQLIESKKTFIIK